MKIDKFLRTPILKNICEQLLLQTTIRNYASNQNSIAVFDIFVRDLTSFLYSVFGRIFLLMKMNE